MNKSERRVRKEIINNFYVPPPARKNDQADKLSVSSQNRKTQSTDSCPSSNSVKIKDRALELKLKNIAEETKICNNSSLLFKNEIECSRPNQCNNESLPKKKRKRKKKTQSSSELKSDGEVYISAENITCEAGTEDVQQSNESVSEKSTDHLLNGPSEINNDSQINFEPASHDNDHLKVNSYDNSGENVNLEILDSTDHKLQVTQEPGNSSESGPFLVNDDIKVRPECLELQNEGDVPIHEELNEETNTKIEYESRNDEVEMLHHFDKFTIQSDLELKGENSHADSSQNESLYSNSDNGQSTCSISVRNNSVYLNARTKVIPSSEETDFLSTNSTNIDDDDEFEWERLLDEGIQEFEFYNSANKVETEIAKAPKSSKTEFEKESNDCSIIEIYGFPEEFKTQDLLIPFSSYVNRGFKLKWVDNTHALGIFPTPAVAEEALNSPLPFVKTRPLSEATPASKEKAQQITLPSALRPKTCTALARRLVSGALGVRAVFTKEEREAEREMLKAAREQKRLAAKQRDAAWEGKF